jgi:hypothetical protein
LGTPKGITQRDIKLATGDKVFIYSNAQFIVLQIRREVATEVSITKPSFKVAVELSPEEAEVIANYLLSAKRLRRY